MCGLNPGGVERPVTKLSTASCGFLAYVSPPPYMIVAHFDMQDGFVAKASARARGLFPLQR